MPGYRFFDLSVVINNLYVLSADAVDNADVKNFPKNRAVKTIEPWVNEKINVFRMDIRVRFDILTSNDRFELNCFIMKHILLM